MKPDNEKAPPPVQGWAVLRDGKIDMRTVGDTPVAAMVNSLVVHDRVMPLWSWSDEKVHQEWGGKHDPANLVEIVVTIAGNEPGGDL